MREIKFRAWDSEKKWWLWESGALQPRRGEGSFDGDGPGWHLSIKPNVIFMQFTGLHDKNGKEIWEGDIIRKDYGHPGDPRFSPEINVVKWDSYDDGEYVHDVECWCAGGYPISDPGGLYGVSKNTIEVLGNTYEHPHLLEPT